MPNKFKTREEWLNYVAQALRPHFVKAGHPIPAKVRFGVGFMADGDNLIHANAHWMQVTTEPLADVVSRLADGHARPVLARKRIKA